MSRYSEMILETQMTEGADVRRRCAAQMCGFNKLTWVVDYAQGRRESTYPGPASCLCCKWLGGSLECRGLADAAPVEGGHPSLLDELMTVLRRQGVAIGDALVEGQGHAACLQSKKGGRG